MESPTYGNARRSRLGFTLLEVMIVLLLISSLIALLLPAVQAIRENARRTNCISNLTQIAIGTSNYYDTFQKYPAGTIEKMGPIVNASKGYHFGWQTQILAFTQENALLEQIDYSKSVYSNVNNSLADPMYNACPSAASGGSFAAVHNDREVPIDEDNNGTFILNRQMTHDDIEDGLSNTIFFGEIVDPTGLGWMSGTSATLRNFEKPIAKGSWTGAGGGTTAAGPAVEVIDFSETSNLDAFGNPAIVAPVENGGFGSWHTTICNFAFGDGSVKSISRESDLKILRRYGNRSDGKLVTPLD